MFLVMPGNSPKRQRGNVAGSTLHHLLPRSFPRLRRTNEFLQLTTRSTSSFDSKFLHSKNAPCTNSSHTSCQSNSAHARIPTEDPECHALPNTPPQEKILQVKRHSFNHPATASEVNTLCVACRDTCTTPLKAPDQHNSQMAPSLPWASPAMCFAPPASPVNHVVFLRNHASLHAIEQTPATRRRPVIDNQRADSRHCSTCMMADTRHTVCNNLVQ